MKRKYREKRDKKIENIMTNIMASKEIIPWTCQKIEKGHGVRSLILTY